MKRPEESTVLENDYSEKSIKIAVFLTSLQQLPNLTIKKFQKFKKKALKYVISNQHLFQQASKNIPLQRIVNSEENQKAILTEMHNNSDHHRYEGTYQQIINYY